MIPYFKIEILAIQDEFVLLGHKGLRFALAIDKMLCEIFSVFYLFYFER